MEADCDCEGGCWTWLGSVRVEREGVHRDERKVAKYSLKQQLLLYISAGESIEGLSHILSAFIFVNKKGQQYLLLEHLGLPFLF